MTKCLCMGSKGNMHAYSSCDCCELPTYAILFLFVCRIFNSWSDGIAMNKRSEEQICFVTFLSLFYLLRAGLHLWLRYFGTRNSFSNPVLAFYRLRLADTTQKTPSRCYDSKDISHSFVSGDDNCVRND